MRPGSSDSLHPADQLLTIADVAAWLGVSKAWVYDHVTRREPRIPCVRFGEMTRFRRSDIEQFIEQHGRGAA
ncbi:MAG: helix-turn-helix domain-containing protein [Bryobacteraceae bacterium]